MIKRVAKTKVKDAFGEFVAEMDEIYQDASRRLAQRRHLIQEYRAFARGRQHGVRDKFGNFVELKPTDPRVHFETLPIISKQVQAAAEQRCAAWPSINVRAPVAGIVGEVQARTMEAIARGWDSLRPDFYHAMVTADYAAEIDGACWGKTFWNPNIGPLRPDAAIGESPREGDWDFDAVPIDQVIHDPTAIAPADIRFAIHRKAMAQGDAELMWTEDIFGEPTKGRFQRWGESRREGTPLDERADVLSASIDANATVEILEYTWKPTSEWPRGLMLVVSGAMVLAYPIAEHVDYNGKKTMVPTLPDVFPWTLNIGANFVPFEMFADGSVDRLIGPQKSLNHAYSRMRQALNWGGMPSVLMPYQAEVKEKALSDVGGDIIKYRAPYAPTLFKGDGIQGSHLTYAQSIKNMMDEVGGYNAESRGLVDSANATASRIRTTAGLNAQLHASTIKLRGFFAAEVSRNIFQIMVNRYEEGRLLMLHGPNGRTRLRTFREGLVDPKNMIYIDASNLAPLDLETKRQQAREDFDRGIYNDTPQAARFRRTWNITQEADEEFDPDSRDWDNARDNAVKFLLAAREGILPDDIYVEVADNNDIHIDVYRQMMLEPEFRSLPPELQDWFKENVLIPHQEARRAKLNEQLQEEGAISQASGSKGKGAAPGTPSPPKPPAAPGRPDEGAPEAPPADSPEGS